MKLRTDAHINLEAHIYWPGEIVTVPGEGYRFNPFWVDNQLQILLFRLAVGVGGPCSMGLVCGGVPEWLKGADCKSVGLAYVGSNPTPSTRHYVSECARPGEGSGGIESAGSGKQGIR